MSRIQLTINLIEGETAVASKNRGHACSFNYSHQICIYADRDYIRENHRQKKKRKSNKDVDVQADG